MRNSKLATTNLKKDSLLLSAKTGGWREEELGTVNWSWGDKGSSPHLNPLIK